MLYDRVRAGGGGSGLVAGGGNCDARDGTCMPGEDRVIATLSPLGLCDCDTPSLPRAAVRQAYRWRAYCFIDSLMR